MLEPNLISKERIAWLHKLLPYIDGNSVNFKIADGKLKAIIHLDLTELQKYLSFFHREFNIEFEVCTKAGEFIPLDYNHEAAIKVYLEHSPLGKKPLPALFKENTICPPPVSVFLGEIDQALQKLSAQLKKEAELRYFQLWRSTNYRYIGNKYTECTSFRLSYDGRQKTKVNKLILKYKISHHMTLQDVIELLKSAEDLSAVEKQTLETNYKLLHDWGELE